MTESELLSIIIFLYFEFVTENWLREKIIIDFVLKTNPWTYKFKDLNGEK